MRERSLTNRIPPEKRLEVLRILEKEFSGLERTIENAVALTSIETILERLFYLLTDEEKKSFTVAEDFVSPVDNDERFGKFGDYVVEDSSITEIVTDRGEKISVRIGDVYENNSVLKEPGIWLSFQERNSSSHAYIDCLFSVEKWREFAKSVEERIANYTSQVASCEVQDENESNDTERDGKEVPSDS